MDTQTDSISSRKDFLLRVAEQFRELADEVGAPFQAEAYIATNVAAYAQGALLELGLFYAAFLRREVRASDLGMEGGYLRDAVAKAKAAFFEQDELVRWQVAREMVTGMRLYYEEAAACRRPRRKKC
jgi:hypothetical protein